MKCNCGDRPPSNRCDECRRERNRRYKRAQRDRDRTRDDTQPRAPRPELDTKRRSPADEPGPRPESQMLLGYRQRPLTRGGHSSAVLTLPGTDEELPPMGGDNSERCRCGLLLQAPSDDELIEVTARHDGACLVLRKPDHWSVVTMLVQRERPRWHGRSDKPAMVKPRRLVEPPVEDPPPIDANEDVA